MTNKLVASYASGGLGTVIGLSEVTTATNQINSILGIILMVLSIISVIISTVIVVLNKVKEAKKDGKIDTDEIVDVAHTIKDGVDDVIDIIANNKPKGDK